MGDGVAYEAMGRLLAQLPTERERKLEAILGAVLEEPILMQASVRPFIARIAERSKLTEEEVWKLTGLQKPEKS